MQAAGFLRGTQPGSWKRPEHVGERVAEVVVDLMIAETFSQRGSTRAGIIPPHMKWSTRKATGLEASALDFDVMVVASLEPTVDHRAIDTQVAGPAALLVSKAFKLHDRITEGDARRPSNKDAGVAFSHSPVRAKTSKAEGVFFVRLNNSTRMLPEEEVPNYSQAHWGGIGN